MNFVETGMKGFAQAGRAALFILIVTLAGAHLAFAQKAPETVRPPSVPAAIAVPPDVTIALVAHASGSQIYTCQEGQEGRIGWLLKAPDAELHDENGKVIGHHSAGPSWKLNDGSMVTGKAAGHVDSPDPDSIPWLLVNIDRNEGKGKLAKAIFIQRLNTHGGKPPAAGCDAQHKGAETKSNYSADYYFYAPK